MNAGSMRGGRRRVLQLDETNEATSLARIGKTMSVGNSTRNTPAGLSALGEYSDSDSNNSDTDEDKTNGNNVEDLISTSSNVPDGKVDIEVATFFSEVNSMSASNSPTREGSMTPPVIQPVKRNTKNLYKSMFVKGATEWNKKDDNKSESSSSEIESLPEEPTTLWQICVDEHTQYQYYWKTISNEVTWTIPPDYTQYLLQYKLYEEQLAKIPEDRREYLMKKKLGLITSPKVIKHLTKPDPPKQAFNEARPEPSPVNVTSSMIGPQLPESKNGVEKPETEGLTDPEKQFYSEIEELEKMDLELSDNQVDLPPLPGEPPPLPEGLPPLPESETNGTKVVTRELKTEENNDDADMNVDIDDIDQALEKALEKKKEELKKLEAAEKTQIDEVLHDQHKHKQKYKRHFSPDSSLQLSKKRKELPVQEIPEPSPEKPSKQTVETVRKALIDYDNTDDENVNMPNRKSPVSDIEDMSDVEEVKEILESKLEFLSVSRKGLTRLQIVLIELQTRYSDYMNGGLSKEYFRKKLLNLEKQMFEYEKSAVPDGWTCQWDRYGHLFYSSIYLRCVQYVWTIKTFKIFTQIPQIMNILDRTNWDNKMVHTATRMCICFVIGTFLLRMLF